MSDLIPSELLFLEREVGVSERCISLKSRHAHNEKHRTRLQIFRQRFGLVYFLLNNLSFQSDV